MLPIADRNRYGDRGVIAIPRAEMKRSPVRTLVVSEPGSSRVRTWLEPNPESYLTPATNRRDSVQEPSAEVIARKSSTSSKTSNSTTYPQTFITYCDVWSVIVKGSGEKRFIPRTPSQWPSETVDIFTSPNEIDQMFGLCKKWKQWLRSEDLAADDSYQCYWNTLPSPMFTAANCLAALATLNAIDPSRPSGEEVLYKAQALREVNKSFASPKSASSDETFSSLILMTVFELSRMRDIEVKTHLQGLKILLDVRNQQLRKPLGGQIVLVETIDILRALLFNERLLIIPELPAKSYGIDLPHVPHLLTCLAAEQPALVTFNAALWRMALLFSRFILCVQIADGSVSQQSVTRRNAFKRDLDELRSQCWVNKGTPSARATSTAVAKACYNCALILYNIVMTKLDTGNAVFSYPLNGLYESMTVTKLETWRSMPCTGLMVLMVAMISTTDSTKRSFFRAGISKLTFDTSLPDLGVMAWQNTRKDFMLGMLTIARAFVLRRGRLDDIREISIDPSSVIS